MRIKTEIVFSWKSSEESVSKEWSQERSDQGWADLELSKQSLECMVLVECNLKHSGFGEWWRSLIGKDLRVEGRGSEDRKYSQVFQGVLPQKKGKIWSSGLAQKVGAKVFVF